MVPFRRSFAVRPGLFKKRFGNKKYINDNANVQDSASISEKLSISLNDSYTYIVKLQFRNICNLPEAPKEIVGVSKVQSRSVLIIHGKH